MTTEQLASAENGTESLDVAVKALSLNEDKTQREHYALVLDTSPFLLLPPSALFQLAQHHYTTPGVLAEITSEQQRSLIQQAMSSYWKINVRKPSAASLQHVQEMATRTGDGHVLSKVDLEVAALTFELHQEMTHLSLDSVAVQDKTAEAMNAWVEEGPSDLDELDQEKDGNDATSTTGLTGRAARRKRARQRQRQRRQQEKQQAPHRHVYCFTNDHALQNLLHFLRLPIRSTEGVVCKPLQQWALRCHACGFMTRAQVHFCPKCGGGDTLLRTSVSLNDKGEVVHCFLKENYQFRLRGTKYSLPAPQGGRHEKPLLLRADQAAYTKALHHQQVQQRKLEKESTSLDDYDFSLGQKRQTGFQDIVIGHGKRNPNARKPMRR